MFPNDTQLSIMILLSLFDLCAKGFALWKAGKNNQRNWFIVLLLLNTGGILPLFYLRYFQKRVSK